MQSYLVLEAYIVLPGSRSLYSDTWFYTVFTIQYESSFTSSKSGV